MKNDIPNWEKLYRINVEYCDLKAIADRKAELKKHYFSMWVVELKKSKAKDGEKFTETALEKEVYASREYCDYVIDMIESEKKARLKYAELEGLREKMKEIERVDIQNAMSIKYGNGYGN